MRAPQCGDAIDHRQRGVGVLRHVAHREVEIYERRDEAPDSRSHHDELTGDCGRDDGRPPIPRERRSGDAKERLQCGQQQGQDQRKVTKLRKHYVPAGGVADGCVGVDEGEEPCLGT